MSNNKKSFGNFLIKELLEKAKRHTQQGVDASIDAKDKIDQALSLLSEQGGIDWVSVKERLPEVGQMIIAYSPDWMGLKYTVIEWWNGAINELVNITHWAEITLPADKPCKTCGGSGEVWDTQEFGARVVGDKISCPDCEGTGKQPEKQESEFVKRAKEEINIFNAKFDKETQTLSNRIYIHDRIINTLILALSKIEQLIAEKKELCRDFKIESEYRANLAKEYEALQAELGRYKEAVKFLVNWPLMSIPEAQKVAAGIVGEKKLRSLLGESEE